jgi:hypothetical protein
MQEGRKKPLYTGAKKEGAGEREKTLSMIFSHRREDYV